MAGILAEVADARRPAVVIGIGLNVGAAPPDQPFATSLAAEGGPRRAGRRAGRAADAAWPSGRRSGGQGRGDPERTRLRADYRAACASLGSEVRVELPGGTLITGIAEDVDPDGRLLLLDPAGHRRAVVRRRRRAPAPGRLTLASTGAPGAGRYRLAHGLSGRAPRRGRAGRDAQAPALEEDHPPGAGAAAGGRAGQLPGRAARPPRPGRAGAGSCWPGSAWCWSAGSP